MEKRRIGIQGIEGAAWGEHICVFFNTKDELLKLTVPYIKAGLEDNEFCMWITGEHVTENDASHALEQVLPDAHQYLARKQLEILPHTQWYFSSGIFDGQIVLQNWVTKATHAQSKGVRWYAYYRKYFLAGIRTGLGAIRSIRTSGHAEHRTPTSPCAVYLPF